MTIKGIKFEIIKRFEHRSLGYTKKTVIDVLTRNNMEWHEPKPNEPGSMIITTTATTREQVTALDKELTHYKIRYRKEVIL